MVDTDQLLSNDPAIAAESHFSAYLFNDLCILTVGFAPVKAGCRRLVIRHPGLPEPIEFRWTSKEGGLFHTEPDQRQRSDIQTLRRFIFPQATVMASLSAPDWAEDGEEIQISAGTDDEELFATSLRLIRPEILVGPVIGLQMHWLHVLQPGRSAEPAAQLVLDGKTQRPAELALTDHEAEFRRFSVDLPDSIYDGEKHNFTLRPADPTASVIPQTQNWRCADTFRLDANAARIAERPRLAAIPPGDVRQVHSHMQSNRVRASTPGLGARSATALSSPRGGGARKVALFIFAPTLEAAAATPGIVNLSGWYGADLAVHFVLPTPETARFGISGQLSERLDQLVPVLSLADIPMRINRLAADAAVVFLPAGTRMEKRARADIDAVLAGKSYGCQAPPAMRLQIGDAVLRVEEESDHSLAASVAEIAPLTPYDLAGVYSKRAALRSLQPVRQDFQGLSLQWLELVGPLDQALALYNCDSAAAPMAAFQIGLVIEAFAEDISENQDQLAAFLAVLDQQGVQYVIAARRSAHKALPAGSPLTDCRFVLIANEQDQDAVRLMGDLMPDCRAMLFADADAISKAAGMLSPGDFVQALRMAGAATTASAAVTLKHGSGTNIRFFCRTQRAIL